MIHFHPKKLLTLALASSYLLGCGAGSADKSGTGGGGSGGGSGTGGTSASGGVSSSGGNRAAGGTGGSGGSSASAGAGGSATGGTTGQTGTGGTGELAAGGQLGSGGRTSSGANTQGTGGAGGTTRQSGTGGSSLGGQDGATTGGGGSSRPDAAMLDQASSGGTDGSGDRGGSDSGATIAGPCDIYQAGNTPCVAAHSTVRALYGAYTGKLYQLRRADKTTRDVGVLAAGGLADSAAQDTFCAGTKCTISIIYDQSPQHNDLTLTKGGWIGDRAKEADAFGIKVTVAGHTVYGVHVPLSTDRATGVGYRNNTAKGTARGDEPESMYMVANGKAFSNECCFDYGNASTNSLNNGPGTMEAIYFGNCAAWGSGDGKGPWVMADLEEGLFSGKAAKLNAANKSIAFDYVTAVVKGQPQMFAIKAGDAQTGSLTTMFEGARPNPSSLGSYDPMKKEGGIILGTGGDNSFMGVGDFFEGAMTAGYASDATDNAVQANITAVGYGR